MPAGAVGKQQGFYWGLIGVERGPGRPRGRQGGRVRDAKLLLLAVLLALYYGELAVGAWGERPGREDRVRLK